ncbi:hypothetical protein RIF25_10265 [Thermosynechococcaceae cyanobacterium BACA0444]|uniref:Uncharacterized protein n=1 Tax=Pseudocalidococcus azoricus BACA0444 TaxID=2918990 RepID=A0AAE4FTR4_9CYAN|nr:hypothetical protein [Pseudocalidococcus azoricus]MDS3861189.1 hypothetical protein [Pseudocalidococcus azoricus BACA0444]
MLRKISSALVLGLVTSHLVGCGGGGEPESTAISPPPLPTPSPPAPETPPAAGVGPSVLGNLTPPTNPQMRVKTIAQAKDVGRPNPFSSVSPAAAPPGLNTQDAPLPAPIQFVPVSQINQRLAEILPPSALPPGRVPAAPLPPPKDAQGVQLFGVAVVGGIPQAIIQAPGEVVSRTVRVGDTLANGVRVTSILAYGSNPAIVLEQFGQQVTVGIGQAQASAASNNAPL